LLTADSIYRVPLILEDAGLGDYVVERLRLPAGASDLAEWRVLVDRLTHPHDEVEIAIVGKYVELHDAYMSVRESLIHAGIHHDVAVTVRWIHSESLNEANYKQALSGLDGIVVGGGFGERGIEGKILAARFAREQRIPYLGLCLGMQVMVIEFARHVFGDVDANSTEFAPRTSLAVIDLMADQNGVLEKGGTMRLGAYPCHLQPGTRAQAAYGEDVVHERHRHRYEFNNSYRSLLEKAGLVISGVSPDGRLVEISELRDHPFMLGSQFHPELRSRPNRPHPLFRDLVGAAVALRKPVTNGAVEVFATAGASAG
jgi:CTP synthase